jgi:septum site-determining protein MinC
VSRPRPLGYTPPLQLPFDYVMTIPATAKDAAALEIRFGPIDLAHVRIRTIDPGAILDDLTGRVVSAPRFFERTAVCVDLSALDREPDAREVRAVVDAIRRAGMLPVALVQGPPSVEALARVLELPVVSTFRTPAKSPPIVQAVDPTPTLEPTLLHQQMVRSGQRLYAKQRDLVVLATVGSGAEVMADGCVHVYGALRGRAMAGVHGDLNARVFCQEFHAELVSIAGVFRVFETLPDGLVGRPVQAWLEGEDLLFARVG